MKKLLVLVLGVFLISLSVAAFYDSWTETRFNIHLDGVCDEQGGFWWEDGVRYDLTVDEEDNKGWCAVRDPDCCPEDHDCVGDAGEELCVWQDECSDISSCSKYTNPETCEGDPCNKGSSKKVCGGFRKVTEACNVEIGNYVGDRTTCSCFWDGNDDDGRCRQNQTVLPVTYESIDVSDMYECIIDVETTPCTGGTLTMSKNAIAVWHFNTATNVQQACANQLCDSFTKQVSCGKPLVRLPFFSTINLIMVIFGLTLFYLIRGEMKKRK